MAALGSLVVSLEANIAKFTSDMGKAAYQTEQAMAKMQRASDNVNAAIRGLAAGAVSALSIDAFAGLVRGTIDAADGMNDLSQRVGIAVADLAKYQLAADQSGTTMESLAKGIKGVSTNMAQYGKELAAAGITATTADGAMRQLADVFANMPDGMEKTALAVKLFGKSGMDLIPMLNMGSEGMVIAAEKSAQYAQVLARLAPQADMFNDNVAELAIASKVMGLSLVNDAIPGLIGISQAMAMAAQDSGVLKAAWVGLGGAMDEFLAKPASVIFKGINNDLDEANAKLMRFLGQNAEADKLTAAVARRNKEIVAITESAVTPNVPTTPKAFDQAKWMADYKAIMGAVGGGPKVTRPTGKTDAQRLEEDAQRFVAKLKEQADTYGKVGAAALQYQQDFQRMPKAYQEQAMAIQQHIDAMKAQDDATKAAVKADIDAFKIMDDLRTGADEENARNTRNVDMIRIGLMNETEQEAWAHEQRLAELQIYHDAKFENIAQANALIEAENARHQQMLADMQTSHELQSLAMMGNAADQLYGLMQKAGKEQSGLAKAAFLASKAISVAEIIMNTEVAAAKAGAQLGIFGIPMATFIRASGYASAGLVAGMAIAGMREKGGPVWAGGAFIVGEKGPEIFKPTGSGTIIPNSALAGGGAGRAAPITIINKTGVPIGTATESTNPNGEREITIEAIAAQFADPNSRVSRAMSRNYAVQRSR